MARDQADELRDLTPTPIRGSPHVVIVGAGFAGLNCAKALGGAAAHVTVVDRRNYHLFVPLLYQVATAALSPADIAVPVRRVLGRYANIDVVMAEASGVDLQTRRLLLDRGGFISFDVLVLATGSSYNYFGHSDWAAAAPGLKTVANARQIRASLLRAYERAELTPNPAERRALLTTVIVGGGPTGVEMAGAAAELSRYALRGNFRRIDPGSASIILVEAGPKLLSGFSDRLGAYAGQALQRLGVETRLNTAVEKIEAGRVLAAGQWICASTIIWGAGIHAQPGACWLPVTPDRLGRIAVGPDLAVRGLDRVYVIGDLAHVEQAGSPLPALAQVAAQEGLALGRNLARSLGRGAEPKPFQYRPRGDTAVIGRHAAVFAVGRLQLKGSLAWLLWALVHIYLLIGFEKRALVATQWLWRYFTYQRGVRLID